MRLRAPQGQQVTFTPAALAKLQKHLWPGNVRELRNVVSRAMMVRKGTRLDAADILFEEESYRAPLELPEGAPMELPEGVTLDEMMQQVERQLVESTLRRCGNHRDRAAKQLGMARSSLFKRLKEWGMSEGEE